MLFTNLRTGSNIQLNLGGKEGMEGKIYLIGNSGSLLGSRLGKMIDDCDGTVCRMNAAIVGGKYGDDVGYRCDLRIVAYNALFEVYKERKRLGMTSEAGCVMILWGANTHKMHNKNYLLALMKEFPNMQFLDVSDSMLGKFDQIYSETVGVMRLHSGAWLSTGWVTLCILLMYQKELGGGGSGGGIEVYGMFGNGCNLYHYWDKGRGFEAEHYKDQQFSVKGHRFLTEHKVFTELWAKKYDLKFVL